MHDTFAVIVGIFLSDEIGREHALGNTQLLGGEPDTGAVGAVYQRIEIRRLGKRNGQLRFSLFQLPGQLFVEIPFFRQCPNDLRRHIGIACRLFQQRIGHIGSMSADRGENFARHPVLEAFGAFQFAGEDQAVKPGFIDKNALFPLISVKDHSFCPVFRRHMTVNISTTVLVPEVIRHVFSNEPGNSVLRDEGMDTPELLILEYLHPVFHILSSFLIQPAPAAWW